MNLLEQLLLNTPHVHRTCEAAIQEMYDNADMEFTALLTHFELIAIGQEDLHYVFTFQQIETPFYHFNVHIDKDGDASVSIDS